MKFGREGRGIIASASSVSVAVVATVMPMALSMLYKTPWWLCLWLVAGPATGLVVALLKNWVDNE